MKNLFEQAGFSYETPRRIKREQIEFINEEFLEGVRTTAINSVLETIRKEIPKEFEDGLQKVKAEVEDSKKIGKFREFNIPYRTIFWGIKQ